MLRLLAGLALFGMLAACGNDTGTDNTAEEVQRAFYSSSGPRALTLMTVVNNRSGGGGHTALLVNGSQQVIFDPAGSFRDARVTERGDVLYGMSPSWVQAYKSAHARSTYHVVSQEFRVTDAQAERALQLVRVNGSVGSAYCANATSAILQQVPGFQSVKGTFFPVNLMNQLAEMPGVVTARYYEDDDGDVVDAVAAAQLVQP